MKKQTAVEWLIKKLENHNGITRNAFENVIQQAKAMEEKQILDSYVYGSAYGTDPQKGYCAVNYYQSTYGK